MADVPTDGLFNVPQVSATGGHVAVVVGGIQRRPAWLLDRRVGFWAPFLDDDWGHCVGEFAADEYVAVTTTGAQRGRVVAIHVGTRRVREIVHESDAVVRAVQALAGGRLLISEYRDASCHLRLVDLFGNEVEGLPEVEPGTITPDATAAPVIGQPMAATAVTSPEVTCIHSSYRRSAGVYAYDTSTRRLRTVREPAATSDDITVTTEFAIADDGMRLPVHIVSPTEIAAAAAPTLLSVYGGFNVATLPRYLAWVHAFCSQIWQQNLNRFDGTPRLCSARGAPCKVRASFRAGFQRYAFRPGSAELRCSYHERRRHGEDACRRTHGRASERDLNAQSLSRAQRSGSVAYFSWQPPAPLTRRTMSSS
jgi:hypothetical protein